MLRRYNTSQLKVRSREVTWDEKGICVWECLIVLQYLGLRRSQDIEWGCSCPVSIECMLATWVMRNLEPKRLPCSNSGFLTCWFFFFLDKRVYNSLEFVWPKIEDLYSGAFGTTSVKKSMARVWEDFSVAGTHSTLFSCSTGVLWAVKGQIPEHHWLHSLKEFIDSIQPLCDTLIS